MDPNSLLRTLPGTDDVLAAPELGPTLASVARPLVVDAVRGALGDARSRLVAGEPSDTSVRALALDAASRAALAARSSLRRVINATGVIVHTNLGRSVLAEEAAHAVTEIATTYSTLEYDTTSGRRGSRHAHIESLLCRLSGAEAAIAVNNNAAAVLLALAALARGHDAIVGRGQLVEIGGSFRIPEIMAESGATMVEVGTTNKTRLADYERALSERTGVLLKVHASNFRVVGFTEEVGLEELVALGRRRGVPVMEDQGSGVLFDLRPYGLPYEPTIAASIAAGADVVTCSGDKLLGGPQAGVIVGRAAAIERLRTHPLARAVRLDKLQLAALEATLRLSLEETRALARIPTLRMLTAPVAEVRTRAEVLAERIREAVADAADVMTVDEIARAGGGSLPLAEIPTVVVSIAPRVSSAGELEERLRLGDPAIVTRVHEGRVLLDPRTVLDPGEEDAIVSRLGEILAAR
jgi:L-seryl-tRNA(Ser) seleniumtransferase